ncbi:MAG: SGNH/GDSL hydrolase family protein [Candidatus Omnitrophota bacterium]
MAAKKVILFIMSIVFWVFLVLGMLETASRFIWPYDMSLRKIVRCSLDPKIIFELKPNTETIFTGQHVKIPPTTIKISSQGIRDGEYSINKPLGVYRVVILGDSVAFGWGVELEQTFGKYLEKMLNEYGAQKYEVINFSVPGYNTVQEVATLESKCLLYRPDLVIFSICGNDYQPAFNYLYPFAFLQHMPDYFYKSRLVGGVIGQLVFLKDQANAHKFKQGIAEAAQAIGKLSELIARNNLKVLFYNGDERDFKDILIKFGFSDCVIESNRGNFFQAEYIIARDGHLNSKGHKKVAESIYDFLETRGYLKVGKN